MDRWQIDKTLTEAINHVYKHGLLCDVTFSVGDGQQKIKAHKLILAARSPVFERNFYGSMADVNTDKPIEITDLDVPVFEELLRYLYTDKCDITFDNVTSLMYAADKYDIPVLQDQCRKFVIEKTTDDDVCDTFRHAHFLGDQKLLDHCKTYILKRAEYVLPTVGFLALSREMLSDLIGRDHLEAEEELVYSSCRKWAEKQCTEMGFECTNENVRQTLGDVFYLIRFPLLKPKMLEEMSQSGELLLTDSERENIRLSIKGKKECLQFNMKERYYRLATIQRLSDCPHSGWVNRGGEDAISFVAYRNASLIGLSVYMPCEPGEVFGEIQIYKDRLLVLELPVKLQFQEGKHHENIMFNFPVQIKKLMRYTIVQTLKGVPTFFGQSGRSTYYDEKITVNFSRSARCSNGTFEKHGQFFRLYLKVPK